MNEANYIIKVLLIAPLSLLLTLIGCDNTPNIIDKKQEIIRWEISKDSIPVSLPIDQLPGIDYYNGKMYFLGHNAAAWNSFEFPNRSQWGLRIGNDIESLDMYINPKMTANFPFYKTQLDKIGWCNYWLIGLWIDQTTGFFYSLTHIEYDYQDNEWQLPSLGRKLGLAISKDEGKTWSYVDDVITQDITTPPPAGQGYNGVGDIAFFIPPSNDYIYVFYKRAFYSLSTYQRTSSDMCVARCKIEDKLAPGKWKKFYNGSWNEPGLGGKETPVIPYTSIISVSYNEYLKKYVAIGHVHSGKKGIITFANDMNLQDWSDRDFSFPDITFWYNWQLNSDKKNPYIMGQTFRMYATGVDYSTTPPSRPSFYYTIKFIKE